MYGGVVFDDGYNFKKGGYGGLRGACLLWAVGVTPGDWGKISHSAHRGGSGARSCKVAKGHSSQAQAEASGGDFDPFEPQRGHLTGGVATEASRDL